MKNESKESYTVMQTKFRDNIQYIRSDSILIKSLWYIETKIRIYQYNYYELNIILRYSDINVSKSSIVLIMKWMV